MKSAHTPSASLSGRKSADEPRWPRGRRDRNGVGIEAMKSDLHAVRVNHLRRKLEQGLAAFGPNLQIPSTDLVEIIGMAGFDFVMLDGEHGAAFSALPSLLLAADAAGVTSLVRVPSHERSVLLPPLELGAGGLQVPFVNTVEQARALVRETKYPPLGERGVSVVTRAARFGFADRRHYLRDANRETLLAVQIESREAAENAAAIAAVPGVDLIFIGPADLAQSYGHPAEKITPPTVRVIEKIIRAVAPFKPVGVSVFRRHEVARWHRLGARYFLTSSAGPLREAFGHTCAALHAGVPAGRPPATRPRAAGAVSGSNGGGASHLR
jgi:4-hydroxy-2-oxoheptanedioate aldolase